MDFAVPADHRVKIKRKDKQILGSYQGAKKSVRHKNNGDCKCSWCDRNSL